MDEARATRMQVELMNTSVGGWTIAKYLGAGKSALVFAAAKDGMTAALKIFDPELVQRFGTDVQAVRIERELSLRGKTHPNLVRIVDGGHCEDTGFFFIVMDQLEGLSLADVIGKVPRDLIWPIVSKIASAAKFLESHNLVHRDIKPDNVFVSSDYQQVWLMDFGVIRPVGEPGVTDANGRQFIGTLQYSSPEFLLRTENDTPDGWRALTFYQIGAVLHDLIMGHRIFYDRTDPFAALVEAVKSATPHVEAGDVPQELVLLSRSCLSKDPELRLRLVSWEQFDPDSAKQSVSSAIEERIRQRQLLVRGSAVGDPTVEARATQTIRRTVDHVEERVQTLVRKECVGNDVFPPASMIDCRPPDPLESFFVMQFEASHDHALEQSLQIWFSMRLLDPASVVIRLHGAASVGTEHIEPTVFDPNRKVLLYQGTLDESILEQRIRSFLYSALDQAQSSPLLSSPVGWLTFNESDPK